MKLLNKIKLRNNQIKKVDDSLVNLTLLTFIDLSKNKIKKIDSLGNMNVLVRLDLSNNHRSN